MKKETKEKIEGLKEQFAKMEKIEHLKESIVSCAERITAYNAAYLAAVSHRVNNLGEKYRQSVEAKMKQLGCGKTPCCKLARFADGSKGIFAVLDENADGKGYYVIDIDPEGKRNGLTEKEFVIEFCKEQVPFIEGRIEDYRKQLYAIEGYPQTACY